MANEPFFKEAFTSLRANRWELFCARWFGRKSVGIDGYFRVTCSYWRGKTYMLKFEEIRPNG